MNVFKRLAATACSLFLSSSPAWSQVFDVLPDIPIGEIRARPTLFLSGLTPELVQQNPVGFTQRVGPTDLSAIPDARGYLVVANYGGRFELVDAEGNVSATPFVDLRDPESDTYSPNFEFGQAHGVTAIAFHPGFADPKSQGYKKFYTLESETAGSGVPDFGGEKYPSIRDGSHHDGILYEYTLGDVADLSCDASCTKRELLRVLQPGWHHNLGDVTFDSDELLLVSSADGSTAGTIPPIMSDNSQMLTNLFGKVLRIDPFGNSSENGQYGIPANPFVDGPGGNVDEILAYGFRNPYRLAFDYETGDLFTSETGENNVESVDRIVPGGNYGWNLKEASFVYDKTTRLIAPDEDLDGDGQGDVAQANGLIDPIFEYDRQDGRSIIGGVLYRGSLLPELQGHYVFADFNGRLFYGDPDTGEEFAFTLDASHPLPSNIHSINVDDQGELYILGIREVGPNEYDGWVVALGASGDFNGDRKTDERDVDLLSKAIRGESGSDGFDLDGDGLVNLVDLDTWVHDVKRTWFGDANLNGEFNTGDLVQVLAAGKYETQQAAGWSQGDWNGDGEFNTRDLVIALEDGGYETGRAMDLASVPEPSSLALLILSASCVLYRRRG